MRKINILMLCCILPLSFAQAPKGSKSDELVQKVDMRQDAALRDWLEQIQRAIDKPTAYSIKGLRSAVNTVAWAERDSMADEFRQRRGNSARSITSQELSFHNKIIKATDDIKALLKQADAEVDSHDSRNAQTRLADAEKEMIKARNLINEKRKARDRAARSGAS
jgi:hypothetical protein